MHPESLSRVLSRLEELGMIEKDFEGYVVQPIAKEFLGSIPLSSEESCDRLLHAVLPIAISKEELVNELKGTWFGVLRWMGCADDGDDVTLKWITEDGEVQVNARLCEGELNVEAKLLDCTEQRRALEASYQLISHVSKRFSRTEKPTQRGESRI